jgi:PAS domain S-box-containing protein
MARATHPMDSSVALRVRALQRLSGRGAPQDVAANAAAALGVLHELASSPATAEDALALLHELQVHQVELEMQGEELRNARAELEATLQRQMQIYDAAPVGCFTVDRRGVLHELNLPGAALLGSDRDSLLGRTLDGFLAPHSARALQAMLAHLDEGSRAEAGALELAARDGASRVVQASVRADPAGGRYLVVLMDLRGYR